MTREISIIVCTYNRASLLADCLQSLARQTLARSRCEILVVDNNSSDETREVVKKFCREYSNFKVFLETEQGHSQARNRGWKEAHGRYVAYIDDDCLAESDWAEKILSSFEEVRPAPSAVGGRILPRYTATPPAWFADSLETRSWGKRASFLTPPADRFGFAGANMAFPRDLLEELGGFSCNFGLVGGKLCMGEDTEFFMRLAATGHGHFWYDPEIMVKHWTPVELFSLKNRFLRSYLCGCSHYYLETGKVGRADLRLVLSAFYQLLKGGGCLVQPSGEKMAFLVNSIERASHQLGVYVESWVTKRKLC